MSIALPLPTAVKATLTGDVDGDGTTELLAKELEGLSGGSVAVTTTDGKVTAFSVTSTPPPPASPTTPPPSSPSSPAPTPSAAPASVTTKPTTPAEPTD